MRERFPIDQNTRVQKHESAPTTGATSGSAIPPRVLEDLLVDIANGDRHSFTALYHQVAGPVSRLVRRVLTDVAQAEEVAQEILLEIWRRASTFAPTRGSALAWILMTAHARAIDRVHSSQSVRERDSRYALGMYLPPGNAVTDRLEEEWDRNVVRAALAALSRIQREVLVLRYYGEYSHAEIAALLDIPLGTAKTRIRDGVRKLRAYLDERDSIAADPG